ncbi:MAG TPA: efflux RND transporter periplasmic adaptor subunit, partial [Polyangiaceae bacterium]|nr:efflux RND transporter periplasmic adaptor subunit [Polyangiaceae bacterium]
TLPGDVRGYEQITLYAKIAGYLRSIDVERGDHVAAGQVLGVIESPENDQDVISARSDAVNKHINAERARRLAPPGIVSEMDKDLAENDERRAQATLDRVNDLKSYEKVRAPFAGVVTARYVDPGALMPAATGATVSAQPLVDVAQVDKVRVFVYVGQDAAPFLGPGDSVVVWQDELPEKQINASITRCAAALDQRTRRMQCEIVIDNRAWGLLPGTSVHVRLQIHAGTAPNVPNEALLIREGKTLVAVVKDRRVHLVEVELGGTDGKSVRILRGLDVGDTIGLNVPVELEDNSSVQPVASPQTPASSGANAAASAKPKDDSEREATSRERALGVARDDQVRNGSNVGTPKPASAH